jgi:hypothetical protein
VRPSHCPATTVIPKIGVEIMMKKAKYRKKVLNFAKPQANMIHVLDSAFANIQLEDSRLKAKAMLEQKGYKLFFNTFLPTIYALDQVQDQFFSNLFCQVVKVFRVGNEARLVRLLAQAWNENYLRLFNSGGSIGLGGLMREEHVKNLLV